MKKKGEIAKYVLIVSVVFGVLFYLSILICVCLDSEGNLKAALLGLFIGALVAPELEGKLIKNKLTYQTIVGISFGVAWMYLLQVDAEYYLAGVLLGGLVGASTPFWAKGLQLPC